MFDFGIDFSFKDQKSPTLAPHVDKEEKVSYRKASGHPRPEIVMVLRIGTSPLRYCLSKLWGRLTLKPPSTTSQL